ncbi:MAG TPA: DUF3577 domain-containing protein [Thiotrichales bacterium]|nr:DUF3577 domain-containing protein [Thiotrichales bacterium]
MSDYFDLHVNGLGYVSRLREVKPRNGKPFWAVSISALTGRKAAGDEEQSYVKFDCRIVGEEALRRLRVVEKEIPERAVLVGFRIGDIYPEAYEYERDGQSHQGLVIKGRLLKIAFIKVDGKDIPFADEEKAEPEKTSDPTPVAEQDFRPFEWLEKNAVKTHDHWVVKLQKEDDRFDEKRAFLKEQGFFFDRKTLSWRREAEGMAHVH